jgi:carboxyl-terminal processing protease
VQELVKITPDTSLKVTIAKWLTPNGVSISNQGITPDYVVDFTEKDITAKRDTQMEKAIEILSKEL